MPKSLARAALAATMLASLCLATAAQAADTGKAGKRRPNILLIIGDDFGVDLTSAMYPGLIDGLVKQYGPAGLKHPDYRKINGHAAETPALAQFARQGMVFTNTWAEPFCSPTRASILTGLFSAKTRVLTYADPLAPHHFSFVQKLKDEGGYSTAIFGKWHMAGLAGRPVDFPGMKPKQAGFELFRGNLTAAIKSYWDYDYQIQDADTPADRWRNETPPVRSLPGIAPTNYADVVKAADTIDWINAQQKEHPDKPWFAWLAFNLAHATAQTKPSQMAVPNADTLPPAALAEMKSCGGHFGTAELGSCKGEQVMRAMTSSVDTLIGKVLEAVDKVPDTYVIYISDNGTPMYDRPGLDFIDNMYLTIKGRGKGTAFESGTRVPMAIRGPGIARSSSTDAYVDTVDIFATILDFAGLAVPKTVPAATGGGTVTVDSVSLSPLLFNKARSTRNADKGFLLTETINLMTPDRTRQAGARNGAYKIVCTNGLGMANCEFFNLVKDPLEEFPLPKPASCEDYARGRWKASSPQWNYCRLNEVLAKESFMQPGYVAQDTPGPGLPPK